MPRSTFRRLAVAERQIDRHWLYRQLLLLTAMAAGLLALFQFTELDMRLAALAFDPVQQRFPLQTHWFLSTVLHHGMKQFSYLATAAALVVCWLGHRGRLNWLPQRSAWLAASGMILIPLCTTLLKMLTNRHCPWDIVEFGGFAPHLGLFDTAPAGLKRGQCFPAGHASAGFLWLVWGVALAGAGRRIARLALVGGLLLGAVMGAGRMLQGAHFLSHTLWSAWLAWAISVGLSALFGATPSPVRPAPDRSDRS